MSSLNSVRRKEGLRARRPSLDGYEPLEARLVLSSSHVNAAAVIGSITGQVTNATNDLGIKGVEIQLINSQGKVVQTTTTNKVGNYVFHPTTAGPYVVHEVAPKGYVQLTPNTSKSAPVGSYAPGAGNSSWNYTSTNNIPSVGPVGPAYWSDIAPAGNLPFQSPININTKAINLDTVLKVNYPTSTPDDIVNNSHQIQAQYTGSTHTDSITAGGTTYNLAQFHFHEPAEITIDGKSGTMEEHFVNLSAGGAESVVAVFLKVGNANAALQPLLDTALAHLTTPNSKTTATSPVDFSALLPTDHTGYYYTGSLTTPPLSQPVNWFIFKTPITLSAAQLGEYESIASQGGFLPNARGVQPLDGRVVNQYNYDLNVTGSTDIGGQSFSLAV